MASSCWGLALLGWGGREKASRAGSGQIPGLRKPDEGSPLSSGCSVKPLGGLEPGQVKLGRKDHEEFHQGVAWGPGLVDSLGSLAGVAVGRGRESGSGRLREGGPGDGWGGVVSFRHCWMELGLVGGM